MGTFSVLVAAVLPLVAEGQAGTVGTCYRNKPSTRVLAAVCRSYEELQKDVKEFMLFHAPTHAKTWFRAATNETASKRMSMQQLCDNLPAL